MTDYKEQQKKPVFPVFPKGMKIMYETREGDDKEYPNEEGHNFRRGKGGMVALSRKEARRKSNKSLATQPNVDYHKFKHDINPAEGVPDAPDPKLTNHDKHKIRQQARKDADKILRELKERQDGE